MESDSYQTPEENTSTLVMPAVDSDHLSDDISPTPDDDSTYTESYIPARIDRLPWTWWHTYFVLALGVSWVLDGLEVTTISLIGNILRSHTHGLGLSQAQVGYCGTVYVCGAVTGSLFFGFLSDRIGRRKLFFVAPSIYLCSTFLTSLTFFKLWLFVCLFFTGFGIGGEYSAMNSAINELIPSRVRGVISILINGTYWAGAAIGGTLSTLLLDTIGLYFPTIGWRLPWILGAVMGVLIFIARIRLPESPRWLLSRGRTEDADKIVLKLERYVEKHGRKKKTFVRPTSDEHAGELGIPSTVINRKPVPYSIVLKAVFTQYKTRSFLCFTLMVCQAFFYNAVFFSYSSILTVYYGVPDYDTGLFIVPFAIGNYSGAVVLGQLFDRIGRKPAISGTFALSGILLIVTGVMFLADMFNALTQTMAWSAVFFVASSAASSGYLTISEVFPAEMRAAAIAIFYSSGTALGGMLGPVIFSHLIKKDNKMTLFAGYVFVSILMIFAAITELVIGIETAGKSLEDISKPLGAVERPKTSDREADAQPLLAE
ncbi:General substrate transporter [Carpediemonas membranifera]|uniref:General substrate transporter n=1 Tax=Carpediemonas membranifera TaxID=201153 RepID=A0A8J6E0J7_9EUKA|nr:General substrate transporter [Carpediemonas membranifera]|eukprot:KAG9391946.1 General substrate transporter [Carpediemonas membranifera]